MSFGFGVGDFLAVAEASKKIWNQFEKSPSYIKDARDELRRISGFIQEEEAGRMRNITDPIDSARVQKLFDACKECVENSSIALDKYKEVELKSKGSRKLLKRVVLRFKYDEQDMVRARERIHNAIGSLESGIRTLDSQLLQHVSSVVERTELGLEDTKAGVERTRISVERLHIREDSKDQTLERQQILDWICPSKVDYADQQNALRKRRQIGIGEWFLDSHEFKNWNRGDRATLLCSGMPGVGKTMITSFVVSNILERYKNDSRTGLAYIYCQFSRHREQTPEYLKSSILRQLLERHNNIPDRIRSLYKSRKGEDDLTSDEVSDLLDFVMSLFKKSIIIIDALDELRSAACKEVVSQVLAFQQKFNINVYATSRYIGEIAQEAPNATQVSIRAREEDLRCSLEIILRRGYLLSKRPDLQQRALSKILQVADGVFLLAVLYAQYLAGTREMTQLSSVLNGLKSVSDPYDVVYANAMQRLRDDHETEHTKLGLNTICWLFLAKRPLRLTELLHVLAIDEDIPSLDEENIPLVSHVLNACAGLVVIDEMHDSVGLFHKTFYEYLIKNQSTWFPHGDETIGMACVTYLSFNAFAGGPCIRPESKSLHFSCQAPDRARYAYGDRLVQYPLYDYAQRYWHDHIRGSDSETSHVVINFLSEPSKLSASFQRPESLAPRTTGMHVAAQLLLERSLKRHLEVCQPDPNVKDNFGRSPLSHAAELNGVIVIDHLINAGANPNFEDNYSLYDRERKSTAHTPLSHAALKGHVPACKALIHGGADVNHRDNCGRSALSYAAEGASEAVARFLLRNGGLIGIHDSGRRTPLCWAAANGSFEVVSLLLDHRANINQVSSGNMTPLLLAAKAGHERTISLLIVRGADVNVMSFSDETSLSRAVEWNLVDSVRLLLRAGVDVNRGTKPAHPLTQATKIGSKEVVHLLVSAGSDVNQRDGTGLQPLAYAAKNGWTDTVQLLLDKGANPNNTQLGPKSALSYAVETGSLELVEMLLERGADVNELNGRFPYCEPLYLALGMIHEYAKSGRPANERILKLLLSKGADPNQMLEWESWRENLLDPPLLHALQYLPTGDALTERLVQSLLDHGARTDIATRRGVSVSACAKLHSKDVQDMLRRYGAQ